MSAVPGRVICSRCGANNFETQAACWKCSASLVGGPIPVLSSQASDSGAPVVAYRPQSNVDPSVAFWSAIALAVFFGPLAIPVGLVFMMLDDRRKVDLGKLTLIAGIISTIVQFIFTFMAFQAVTAQLFRFVPALTRGANQPGLNDEVGDGGLRIPGFPAPAVPQTTEPPPGADVPFPEPPPRR